MGLRSNFKRLHKDYYPTFDPKAVQPLIPHLRKGVVYAEPAAGRGHLIRQLEPHATCLWATDIEIREDLLVPGIQQRDALTLESSFGAEMFITNPPWSRDILHPLIVRLSDIAPTWLLFDSNWANTKQSSRYMSRCRRIVSVGRIIWMEGTKTASKDDCSWYLFDRPVHGSVPAFYGRGVPAPDQTKRPKRVCYDCGQTIDRFGKWRLQNRNGILTPVHIHCDNPDSRYAKGDEPLAPAPLLDWMKDVTCA